MKENISLLSKSDYESNRATALLDLLSMAQSNGVFNCVSKTIDGEHHIAFCLMTIKPTVDCIISSSDTYEKYVEVYNSLMIPFIKRKLEVIKKITDIATQEELELVGIDTNKWELSLKEYVVE